MQILSLLFVSGVLGMGFTSALYPGMVSKAENVIMKMMMIEPAVLAAAETDETIPKLAEGLGDHKYVEYLTKASLIEELEIKGPFTAFAPTDEVYRDEMERYGRYLKNETMLEAIMKYSIMTGELVESEIKNDMMVPTLLGGDFKIRLNKYKDGQVFTASGRVMTMPEKTAKNGKLFQMKGVLMPPPGSILKSLSKCPKFKILTKVLKMAGLEPELMGEGPFTIFAPTDEAFKEIPEETLDDLMKNKTALTEVLMYHVIKGTYYTAAWTDHEKITMASGKEATVTMENDKWMVNTIPIHVPDTTCTNGVVHAIDAVLMPPTTRVKLIFSR